MSYQQYFVVVALVIPVFLLPHVLQYRKFSRGGVKPWLLSIYLVVVLCSAILGELGALGFVWNTGFPGYSPDHPQYPDQALTTAKAWLDLVVCVLVGASLIPALDWEPQKKPRDMENDRASVAQVTAPPLQLDAPVPKSVVSESSGWTIMTVGLTALVTAALMVRGQKRHRVHGPTSGRPDA